MDTMHLFAGVGGGLLADLILGHRPIVAVEWDKYACQVLRERAREGWFPYLSVWEGDVRMFDPSEYAGSVDCIHAGFPCQDLSNAGNQAGLGEETRSGLYREVIRIAGIVRPRYIFLENVSAILGLGLEYVLSDLAAMGFDAEWGCVRASDCGAPHQRDRWWLLASDPKRKRQPIKGGYQYAKRSEANAYREADWLVYHVQRSAMPYVCRRHDGVPANIHRIKGLGNAQVPLQAAVAWKLLGGE